MTTNEPPKTLKIDYEFSDTTGLWIATSPDLRGLMVIDKTQRAVVNRLPKVATELVAAMGYSCRYEWADREPLSPDFDPLLAQLVAAKHAASAAL